MVPRIQSRRSDIDFRDELGFEKVAYLLIMGEMPDAEEAEGTRLIKNKIDTRGAATGLREGSCCRFIIRQNVTTKDPGRDPGTDGCGDQNSGDLQNKIKMTQSFRIIDAFLDSVCGKMKQKPGSEGKSLRFLNKNPRKTCRKFLEKSG